MNGCMVTNLVNHVNGCFHLNLVFSSSCNVYKIIVSVLFVGYWIKFVEIYSLKYCIDPLVFDLEMHFGFSLVLSYCFTGINSAPSFTHACI